MDLLPSEVIVAEDCPKNAKLGKISERFQILCGKKRGFHHENEHNLGYDANIRKLIGLSQFKWVILIGNTFTVILPTLRKDPDIAMVSRPFVRFETSLKEPIGVSRILPTESCIKKGDDPKLIF
jgi:hypothetical protein